MFHLITLFLIFVFILLLNDLNFKKWWIFYLFLINIILVFVYYLTYLFVIVADICNRLVCARMSPLSLDFWIVFHIVPITLFQCYLIQKIMTDINDKERIKIVATYFGLVFLSWFVIPYLLQFIFAFFLNYPSNNSLYIKLLNTLLIICLIVYIPIKTLINYYKALKKEKIQID
jgi:hypothetical protein